MYDGLYILTTNRAQKGCGKQNIPIWKGADMLKKKNVSFVVCICVIVGCMIAATAFAEAEQKKIQPELALKTPPELIRLHYIAGISPADVIVKAGTTVIWMNDSRAPVQLQFQGRQVTMACKSPVNFVIDENGSFISNLIPQGSVASLCFVEKGTYNYVFRKGMTATAGYDLRESIKEFKGIITVE